MTSESVLARKEHELQVCCSSASSALPQEVPVLWHVAGCFRLRRPNKSSSMRILRFTGGLRRQDLLSASCNSQSSVLSHLVIYFELADRCGRLRSIIRSLVWVYASLSPSCIQAIVRQKDFELEQRTALLYKTKAAIEDLQHQIYNSRLAEARLHDEADKVAITLSQKHSACSILLSQKTKL